MSVGDKLVDSVCSEDDAVFYRLLEQVTDTRELNQELKLCTPLSVACRLGRLDYVYALLKKGADVNFKTGVLRQAPIHFAANNGQLKCIELLYEHGADLNAQNADKSTALHIACTLENIDLFNFLVEKGAYPNLLDLDLESPLIKAILAQNSYMIKRLVSAGSYVNFPNGDPLEYLIRANPPMMDCVKLFITKGADLSKRTYLNTACASNNIEMMHILKRHGVNINASSDIFNFTALHHACVSLRASHEVVEILLDWGADVNVESSTSDTPLHYACQQCNLRKVLALLDYNPDMKRKDSSHMTPLAALLTTRFSDDVLGEYFKIAKLLIAAGASVTKEEIELFQKEIPVALSTMQTEQQIFDYIQTLKDYMNQPITLQDLCRQTIRCCVGSQIGQKVQVLPLPSYLKNFVLLKDII